MGGKRSGDNSGIQRAINLVRGFQMRLLLTPEQAAQAAQALESLCALDRTTRKKAPPPRFLTPQQVADLLNVAPTTVRSWCLQGLIKEAAVTPGGHRRFEAAQIRALMERLKERNKTRGEIGPFKALPQISNARR